MASYLLNATEGEMLRWKAAAAARRLSFAEFLRIAAERESRQHTSVAPPPPVKTVEALPASGHLAKR